MVRRVSRPRTRPEEKASIVVLGVRLTVTIMFDSGNSSTESGWVSYCVMEGSSRSEASSSAAQSTMTRVWFVSSSKSRCELSSSSSALRTNSGTMPALACSHARSSGVGQVMLTQQPGSGASTCLVPSGPVL